MCRHAKKRKAVRERDRGVVGRRADAEGRDLTPGRALSRRGADREREVDARARAADEGARRRRTEFRDPHRPEPLSSRAAAGQATASSRRRATSGSGLGRPRPDVDDRSRRGLVVPCAAQGHDARDGCRAARVAGRSRRVRARHRVASCSSRSAVREVFGQSNDHRQPGPVRQRGHRDVRGRGCGRGGTKPESTINMAEIVEPIKQDRDGAPDLGRDARGRPVDPELPERQADACSCPSRRSGSCSAAARARTS